MIKTTRLLTALLPGLIISACASPSSVQTDEGTFEITETSYTGTNFDIGLSQLGREKCPNGFRVLNETVKPAPAELLPSVTVTRTIKCI
jgi:hypothetical protein